MLGSDFTIFVFGVVDVLQSMQEEVVHRPDVFAEQSHGGFSGRKDLLNNTAPNASSATALGVQDRKQGAKG
jgi:hypothetical protein